MVAGLVFTEFEWTTHFGFLPLVGFACTYFFYYKIADFGFFVGYNIVFVIFVGDCP